MKNKLFLLLFLPCFLLTSCSKDEKDSFNNNNYLVGTKWVSSYDDYFMVIEFVSEKTVQAYFAKNNLIYDSGETSSSYSIKNGTIFFNNLELVWLYAHYKFNEAKIEGSFMKTSGKHTFNIQKNHWYDDKNTFVKH